MHYTVIDQQFNYYCVFKKIAIEEVLCIQGCNQLLVMKAFCCEAK